MSIEEDLKEAMIHHSGSFKNFCEEVDISKSTIDSLLKREIKNGSVRILKPICDALSISVDGLLNNEIQYIDNFENNKKGLSKEEKQFTKNLESLNYIGKNKVYSYAKDLVDSNNYAFSNLNIVPKTFIKRLPLVEDLRVSAGLGSLDNTDINAIYKDFELNETTKNADIAYIIKGDSMESLIFDGDTIFVHKQDEISNNEIGLFFYDGEVLCKRLIKDGNKIILRSENKKYKDIIINENLEFKTGGKVLI